MTVAGVCLMLFGLTLTFRGMTSSNLGLYIAGWGIFANGAILSCAA